VEKRGLSALVQHSMAGHRSGHTQTASKSYSAFRPDRLILRFGPQNNVIKVDLFAEPEGISGIVAWHGDCLLQDKLAPGLLQPGASAGGGAAC
jgi:hypothetical protein